MTELVVKIPKGKLPFLGVCYNIKLYNPRENEDLIRDPKYKGAEYILELEVIRNKINLKLICEEHIIIRHYYSISFDGEELKRWRQLTKGKKEFNFGHVTRENEKDVIMTTPWRKPIVFRVTDLRILIPEDYMDDSLPYG